MFGLEGEYRFLRRIGRGAEGEVWLAEDLRRDGRLVAWKRISTAGGGEPEEFRRRRATRHPTLSPVFESGVLEAGRIEDGDGRWFTSPFFPGLPLDQLPEPLDPRLLEGILHRVLGGLAALNDAELRHGDLKPGHILWSGPRPLSVRIIDFGHATLLDEPFPERIGTPPYAGPELWSDPPRPGRNSDIYALAMCALECLRGGPVITTGDLAEWRAWHERGDRGTMIAECTVDAPARLLDTLAACLSPDPADRPRDAASLLRRLHPLPTDYDEFCGDAGTSEVPLTGREEWLAGAMRALSEDPGAAGLLVHGAPGCGRSRLLRAIAGRVQAGGGVAVHSPVGEPISPRTLSALAQRATKRLLLVDDVGRAEVDALVVAWSRIRSLSGGSPPRLVAVLSPELTERERAQIATRLSSIAGPIRHSSIPGLDRRSFVEIARLEGVAPPRAEETWRESGGAPGALRPTTSEAPDFTAAAAALGDPLAGWLARIPTSVPWSVLEVAAGLSTEELWRRIAAAGTLAPSVIGAEGNARMLPWAAPAAAIAPGEVSSLRDAWIDADGETGRWASLVLECGTSPVPPARMEEWARAVGAARRGRDGHALAALAAIAAEPSDREWIAAEARSRLGDPVELEGNPVPANPDALSQIAAVSAAWVIERAAGPEAALPFARRVAALTRGVARDEARISAARLSQAAGRTDEVDLVLAEPIDPTTLSPFSSLELGSLLFRRGELTRAEKYFRSALGQARGGVDPNSVTSALTALVGIARQSGDLPGAAEQITVAIRYARLAGIEGERPELALNRGAILRSLGRSDEALSAYRRAEDLIAGRPDRTLETHALVGIGTVLLDRGDLLPALRSLHRAVQKAREAGLNPLLAMCLGNLGRIELLLGLPRKSLQHREELLEIANRSGDPALLRQARIAVAEAALAAGHPDRSQLLLTAAAAAEGGGWPRLEAWEHTVRSELYLYRREYDAAIREGGRALRTALRSGREYSAAVAVRVIARVVAERNDGLRARRLLTRGLELARRDPSPQLSRIPLELERLRLAADEPSVRVRAIELAREAFRLGLVEEFLIAAELAGDRLPEALEEARTRTISRMPRRYGQAGIEALKLRRQLGLSSGNRSERDAYEPAALRIRTRSAPILEDSLECLRHELGAAGILCLVRPGKLWRSIGRAGTVEPPEEPSGLPDAPSLWRAGDAWRCWVPFSAGGAAALWLVGSGRPPDSAIELGEIHTAVCEERAREDLERLREQLVRMRAQVRRLREEKRDQREHLETRLLTQRLEILAEPAGKGAGPTPWITRSAVMVSLGQQLGSWARSTLPILLWGESGVGKTELIRRLEKESVGPFICENCAALPEPLLEAELFGSMPGAFTGSDRERPGLLQRCEGGTLVLDHIDELPPPLQAKLLRVLDDGRFRPLGGEAERQVSFRLVATVRDDPSELVDRERLRPDLYYRLKGIEARVPPLRERPEEIEPLLTAYLGISARTLSQPIPAILPDALRGLEQAPWPGNVRELVNLTQRWSIEGRSMIRLEDLASDLPSALGTLADGHRWNGGDWRAETDRFHRDLLTEALERFGGNQTQTAQALGISRRHLQNLLNKLGFRD